MQILTDRLLLRPLTEDDAASLFILDSDPEVMRYLGNRTVQSIDEVHTYLQNILQQYKDNGIGRWAVIDLDSKELMGWAGIKFIREESNGFTNFYDLGYRLRPAYWGKGYATEATQAWINFAKDHLETKKLYASAHIENLGSQNVLKKCGFVETGQYDFEIHDQILMCNWYELPIK